MKISFKKIIFLLMIFSCSEFFAFSLKDAVNTTLSTNQNIKITKENLTYLKGIKLSNEEIFNPIAITTITSRNSKSQNSALVEPKTEETINVHKISIRLEKYFTSGITLSSGYTYNYNDVEQNPKNSDQTIYLNLTYPLLKYNTKKIVTGNLEFSNIDIKMEKLNYEQKISDSILDTITAYWNYVKLHEVYKLNQLSLQRSDKFYKVIEILTNADEKPKSDLKQPMVDVINKKLSLITSKNNLINGQNDLCVTMDISLEQCMKLTKPSDSFEPIGSDANTVLSSDIIYHKQLDENRFDLKVLDLDLEKSQLSLDISKDDLNHDLDLKLEFLKNSQNLNTNISIPILSSNDRKGSLVQLSLSYKLNLKNNYKKGQYISSLSKYTQKRYTVEKIRKDAHFELERHLTKIRTTISQYKQIKRSIEIYKEILQDEIDKYQLGMATILDVILIEESLISTKLSMISCLHKFSLESIKLKYYTQTLLTKNSDSFIVNYGGK